MEVPLIDITPEAQREALRLQAAEPLRQGQHLRIWVSGKDCSGLLYGVGFDEALVEDQRLDFNGLRVIIDQDSARYLAGSTVTWADGEHGQGFVVENPRAETFRGKFFLRQTP